MSGQSELETPAYDSPILLRVGPPIRSPSSKNPPPTPSTDSSSTYDQPNPSISIFIGGGSKLTKGQTPSTRVPPEKQGATTMSQTPSIYDNLPSLCAASDGADSRNSRVPAPLQFVQSQLHSEADYCEIEDATSSSIPQTSDPDDDQKTPIPTSEKMNIYSSTTPQYERKSIQIDCATAPPETAGLFRSSFHASLPANARDAKRAGISPPTHFNDDDLSKIIGGDRPGSQSARSDMDSHSGTIIRRAQVRLSSGQIESKNFGASSTPASKPCPPALPANPPPSTKPEIPGVTRGESSKSTGSRDEPIMRRGQGQRSSHDSAYHSSSAHSSCSDEQINDAAEAPGGASRERDAASFEIGSYDIPGISTPSTGTSTRPVSSVSSSGRSSFCSNLSAGSTASEAAEPASRMSNKTLTLTEETEATYTSITDVRPIEGDEKSLPHDHALSAAKRQELLHRSHVTYLDRVVIELLDTELAFVNDMHDICLGYKDLFMYDLSHHGVPTEFTSEMFASISDVVVFNRRFYTALDKCELDYVRIAQTFVEHGDGFGVYSNYCTSYPRMISAMESFESREQIAELITKQQTELSHALPLTSYLLKPVQRILKYHLFLQNMLKHCAVVNHDRSDPKQRQNLQAVEIALQQMTAIAREINEAKKKSELAMKVEEVSRMLAETSEDILETIDPTSLGHLVREGKFRLFGTKTPTVRQLYLFERVVLMCKERAPGVWTCKLAIKCCDLMIKEAIGCDPLCFQVWHINKPKCFYTLQASSIDERREWTQDLKRQMLECSNLVIPAHARELIMAIRADEAHHPKGGKGPPLPNTAKYLEKRRKSIDANADKQIKKQSAAGMQWKKYSRSQSSDHLGIKAGTHEQPFNANARKKKDKEPASSSKLENFFASRKMSSGGRGGSTFARLLDSTGGSQLIPSRSNRNRRSYGESDLYSIKKKNVSGSQAVLAPRSMDAESIRHMSKSLDADTFLLTNGQIESGAEKIDKGFLIDRVTGKQGTLMPPTESHKGYPSPDYYQQRRGLHTAMSPCGRKMVKKQALCQAKSWSFDQQAIEDHQEDKDIQDDAPEPENAELAYEQIWEEMIRFIERGDHLPPKPDSPTTKKIPVPKKNCVQLENLYCTCDHESHPVDPGAKNEPARVQSAVDRLSNLIGHIPSEPVSSVEPKVELFSALERARPPRPSLRRPRSLGSLVAGAPAPIDSDDDLGLYESLVEKNLDEVDSAIFSDEELDWLITASQRLRASEGSTTIPPPVAKGVVSSVAESRNIGKDETSLETSREASSAVDRSPTLLPAIVKRFGDLDGGNGKNSGFPRGSDPDLIGIVPVKERIKSFQDSNGRSSQSAQSSGEDVQQAPPPVSVKSVRKGFER